MASQNFPTFHERTVCTSTFLPLTRIDTHDTSVGMGVLNIRNVEPEFIGAMKVRAYTMGVPLRAWVLATLAEALEKNPTVLRTEKGLVAITPENIAEVDDDSGFRYEPIDE
jgi:hypothetical protein